MSSILALITYEILNHKSSTQILNLKP